MKKINILVACFLTLSVWSSGCGAEAAMNEVQPQMEISTVAPAISELEILLQTLQKQVPGQTIFTYECDDFDGDGKKELFALVLTKPEYTDDYYGDIWFVSPWGSEKLESGSSYYTNYEVGCILNIEGTKLYSIEKTYAAGQTSYLFGVRNGKAYRESLSGKGLLYSENGRWYLDQNALDALVGGGGRTIKPYYMYWDNGFKEYGGIDITIEDFLKLEGADTILNGIDAEKGIISHIYYRENNIMNIDYIVGCDSTNVMNNNLFLTCQYDKTSVRLVEVDYNIGTYLSALVEEIATYPAKFHLNE